MNKYSFHAMSTKVELGIVSYLDSEILHQVEIWLGAIENTCSRFRPDSELSQLNEHVGEERAVSFSLFQILEKAEEFYKDTDGIFNPGILTTLEQEGYTKSIEYIRDKEVEALTLSTSIVPQPPFTLNTAKGTVTLHTRIDLGGIAKGWALDYIAALLEAHADGFINIGGDIRVFGTLPYPLHLDIENPLSNTGYISSIDITSGGLATSTSAKRKWLVNGEYHHHLIDPATAHSSQSPIISATVTANSAVQADVWAKVVLLLGEEKGKQWIHRKGIHAVLVGQDGSIWKEQ
ncbi:FAD:protein FMN transferase [Ectobacillus sp. sgz5001026]|uniref:FAD:protein FMN transferase n=1 Tax=Ectobacillus sp. sgz5001026 TaxID=3242473 RepID=UPI0036D41F26